MIKATNIDKVFAEIDQWFKDVEEEVEKVAIGLSYIALGRALYWSPQYSGDFAANWKLYVGQYQQEWVEGRWPDKSFPSEDPYQRLDDTAMDFAIAANEGRVTTANFRLGQTIWLANSSQHDGGDLYAWKIEDGLIKLRPQNYGGDFPLRRTRNYIKSEFGRITKSNVEFLRHE